MAASSSSQVLCGKYDVFISFRGTDVRFGFLSHLERELDRKGVDVYVDDRLEGGEAISSALMNAIEGSMIALIIFSKDYASSRWCLEELVKIMACMEAGQQIVIPVFYDVDPSDVRHQKRTYAEAFTLHEERSKDSVDNVQIWRSVLKKSANLSGHHSSEFRSESKLIDAIVEDVLKKLEDNSPIVPQSHLIGFDQNFTSVESLMEIELQEEVRILGIWGMGGIGKTTLAHAIFDKFLSKFESRCFLENMREKSTKVDGLNSLHQELISKLLNIKDPIDMKHTKRRLQGKKVLIVLDDVDNPKQLKDLVGHLQLGQGSRVIVTSRDMHVLRNGGIHDQFIHGVIELSSKESLELFSIHAFDQRQPKEGYQELSQKTVEIAKGIPLALEVLGSHFHCRDKAYWESELSKLERYPLKQIQNILKISYDGLDDMDKEILFDIAFFFVRHHKDDVTCVLEACGFKAVSGIQNLIDKALIKLDEYGDIVMHDLIQEMAAQIVREQSVRHPGRRSRLKDADEICDVLENNMGTDEIEGIALDVTQIKCVLVEANAFVKMKNLRILKIFSSTLGMTYRWRFTNFIFRRYEVILSDCDSFCNKMRYLHWVYFPLETLPLGYYLKTLVELHMEYSNVIRLWDGKQDLGNLKTINLSYSIQLIELPDLSMAHKLERVYLNYCSSLTSVHPSILSLPNIIVMHVFGCSDFSFESETHVEVCFYNRVIYCKRKLFLSSNKLSRLCLGEPEDEILHFPIGHFRELRHIKLCGGIVGSVSIDELRCLTNLEVFEVINLKQVMDIKLLHSLFDAWRNLRELRLEGCSYLSEIPDNIKALTRLEYLSLKDSAVETLPACVNHLSSLKDISLRRCKRLKSILGLPPFLQNIDASDCTLLETVSSDSPVQNNCTFNFVNCEKLDKRYIEELILSPMTSAREWDGFKRRTIYLGSRVPEWMEYKPMTEALNATEVTFNLERSHDLLLCCLLPLHQPLRSVRCIFSHDSDCIRDISYFFDYPALIRDHVLLWSFQDSDSLYAKIGNDAKISCEFSLNRGVPAKACGAHLINYSEPEPTIDENIDPTDMIRVRERISALEERENEVKELLNTIEMLRKKERICGNIEPTDLIRVHERISALEEGEDGIKELLNTIEMLQKKERI